MVQQMNLQLNERYGRTIGAKFYSYLLKSTNINEMRLDIWDTGGDKKYDSLRHLYTKNAFTVLIMYDATK